MSLIAIEHRCFCARTWINWWSMPRGVAKAFVSRTGAYVELALVW